MDEIDSIQREDPPNTFSKKYIQHFQVYSNYWDVVLRIKSE